MNRLFNLLALAASASAVALPVAIDGHEASVGNGGSQLIPTTPKAPGTFSNGLPQLTHEPAASGDIPSDIYGPRDVDLPFGRLFNGNLHFFKSTNDPATNTSQWGSQYDDADQSACGIPANAYFVSGVAISPYFLKYAGLDRYCMQDVCISFWTEDGSQDMMLKVTDICTPDSADGLGCTDPMDIKIDRAKASIIFNQPEGVAGDTYPEKVWWFFVKCWDDGLAQPAYQNNGNWFTEPSLPNNLAWGQSAEYTQYFNNQNNYPAKGWETYPNGSYNTTRVATPINDYDPGNLPEWTPIAGGKGSSLNTVPPAAHMAVAAAAAAPAAKLRPAPKPPALASKPPHSSSSSTAPEKSTPPCRCHD